MADSAGAGLLARAARALRGRWLSVSELARVLYGASSGTRSSRMSGMVRARRPVNKLRKLGLVAVRATGGVAEYTLLPEGEFICSKDLT